MTYDASNSLCASQGNIRQWKDNLAVYQKSLRAFLQAPLQMDTTKLSGKPNKMLGGGAGGANL